MKNVSTFKLISSDEVEEVTETVEKTGAKKFSLILNISFSMIL